MVVTSVLLSEDVLVLIVNRQDKLDRNTVAVSKMEPVFSPEQAVPLPFFRPATVFPQVRIGP